MEYVFWFALFLLFYSYLGYGLVLFGLIKLKRIFWNGKRKVSQYQGDDLPEVTLVVAAYNEEEFIEKKINNSLQLEYPEDKLKFLFVTDGSNDRTPDIVKKYSQIRLFHKPGREGKIAAVSRVMPNVDTPITVFSDANTILNERAIINLVRHFKDEKIGAVAGEKRIEKLTEDNASGAGEGFYWHYESKLKKWDAELYSVVGAAGELFCIRTALFEDVQPDTLIEDFVMTMIIAKNGYRVLYEPEATATESSSASIKEETKRKIRIAAGGIQAILRLSSILNIFRYGLLSFQYISHRVLRWTLAPLSIPIIFIFNWWLIIYNPVFIYKAFFLGQCLFYLLGLIGQHLEAKKIKFKIFFIPYYFLMMNWCVFMGYKRFLQGKQSVIWEKAERRKVTI
nr:glycosyltransferase family 2 protein [Flexithrix dorotheae]